MSTTPAAPRHLPTEFQSEIVIDGYFPGPLLSQGSVGTVTADTNANMADADKVVISDGSKAITYEYDKSANGVTAGNVSWTAGTTAASVATNLKTAILANQPALSVVDNLAGVLTITNRWPGSGGNIAITKVSASALAVTGMSGGISGDDALTATSTIKFHSCDAPLDVTKVEFYSKLGLAASDTDYFVLVLKNLTQNVTMATWSTKTTGGNGALTADTFKTAVLDTTDHCRAAAGDVLALVATATGAPSLPPGMMRVHARKR